MHGLPQLESSDGDNSTVSSLEFLGQGHKIKAGNLRALAPRYHHDHLSWYQDHESVQSRHRLGGWKLRWAPAVCFRFCAGVGVCLRMRSFFNEDHRCIKMFRIRYLVCLYAVFSEEHALPGIFLILTIPHRGIWYIYEDLAPHAYAFSPFELCRAGASRYL